MTATEPRAAAQETQPLDPSDFYVLNGELSPADRRLRDRVRAFVDNQVLPVINRHVAAGTFPRELVPEMGRLGLFNTADMSPLARGLVCRELERGDSALRTFATVQGSLVTFAIHHYGSAEQRRRWLPLLARGEAIGCFGMTEPEHGSNPAGMVTRAHQDGDHWVLEGAKSFITNGSVADVALIWARDEAEELRGFLVERGTPGFTARDVEGVWSLRASVTSEMTLQGCRLPASAALPGARGLKSALRCLNEARYDVAWGALGAAAACFDAAREHARQRVQFGRPIGAFQLVQQKLVWMLSEITKGELLAAQLAQLKARGLDDYPRVSLAKMNNARMALECARLAREILGARGMLDTYPVFRHMKNLETLITYEGTTDIHTLILGRAITGLSAFA